MRTPSALSRRSSKYRRIVFWGDITTTYNRNVLRAVTQAAQQYPQLRVFLNQSIDLSQIHNLIKLKLSGVIVGGQLMGSPDVRPLLGALAKHHVPIVDVSSNQASLGFPRICPDDLEIGRMAAGYFIERGFRRLVYFGVEGQHWAGRRWQGFAARATEHRLAAEAQWTAAPTEVSAERLLGAIVAWLHHLVRPCAIFAGVDSLAAYLIEACQNQGLAVPEDIAILGCNDDDLFGQLREPKISSIALDTRRIGAGALTMLYCLMGRKHGSPPEDILVAPLRVVTRRSSDIFAVEDELVRAALKLIRDRLDKYFSVKSMVRSLATSRSTLERRFAVALGRSPAAEVRRVQMDIARMLLQDTELSIENVAERAGFYSRRQFTLAFHRQMGITPRAYRQAQRRGRLALLPPPPGQRMAM